MPLLEYWQPVWDLLSFILKVFIKHLSVSGIILDTKAMIVNRTGHSLSFKWSFSQTYRIHIEPN